MESLPTYRENIWYAMFNYFWWTWVVCISTWLYIRQNLYFPKPTFPRDQD